MKKLLGFLIIFLSTNLIASNFNGNIKRFKQPDGSYVDVKLFGSEYYMRSEGLDGYTLLRDQKTKWICYAKLSADSTKLLSTGIVYRGLKDNPGTLRKNLPYPKHMDILPAARKKIIESNKKKLNKKKTSLRQVTPNDDDILQTPVHHVSGNIKGICIVVDFSDEVGTLPISEFNAFCNDLNYNNFGNNGSLRKYYSDVSGGLLDYENVVFGYFRAPQTFADYDAMPYAEGAQEILGLALNWIDNLGFDFSTLTQNTDGTIMAINLMYTGNPPNWAEGMWHHKGYYDSFTADGVTSGDYNCSPANDPLELSVVAHENGHMIGKWPDTYKYESTTGPDGIGSFDLMCWYGDSHNPTVPNPLFRSNAGWGQVIDVTNYNGLNYDTANSGICYIYKNINDTNEFFLLENRMKTGRSTFISDEGLTIWHIDRNGDNQTTHHEVKLMPANNNVNSQTGACFHLGSFDEFAVNTVPNSKWYNGDPSGLRAWDIGSEQTILDYKLGAGQAAPVLNILYTNFTNDDNGNGFIEAGESFDVHVTGLNVGQLSSDTVTISCTDVSTPLGLVTVNTMPITVGVLDTNQSVPVTFNISLSALIAVGDDIKLKFLISDGVNSIYITKTYTVGEEVWMDNVNHLTCGMIFYDEGGPDAGYENNSDFVKTFLPATGGQKIKAVFTSFGLEDETDCSSDFLNIYDGPNAISTLINTYCGTTLPGTFISTDGTGALTFEFHSNGFDREPGWRALISCTNTTGIEEENFDFVEISPNPSNGTFVLKSNTNNITQAMVTDVVGNIIYQQSNLTGNNQLIDLSEKQSGLYFISIKTKGNWVTQKIILKK